MFTAWLWIEGLDESTFRAWGDMIALRLADCKLATIILPMDIHPPTTDGQVNIMLFSQDSMEKLLDSHD